MQDTQPAVLDRRRHPRKAIRVELPVEMRFEVPGDRNPGMLLTRGNATDISHGGVRCEINLNVPVGTRVDVRFTALPRGSNVLPRFTEGHVVRVESVGGVPDQVAIAFARPLQVLQVEGRAEAVDDGNRRAGNASSSGVGPVSLSPRTVGGLI